MELWISRFTFKRQLLVWLSESIEMKTCTWNLSWPARVRQPQLNLKDEGYLPYSSKSSFNCLFLSLSHFPPNVFHRFAADSTTNVRREGGKGRGLKKKSYYFSTSYQVTYFFCKIAVLSLPNWAVICSHMQLSVQRNWNPGESIVKFIGDQVWFTLIAATSVWN